METGGCPYLRAQTSGVQVLLPTEGIGQRLGQGQRLTSPSWWDLFHIIEGSPTQSTVNYWFIKRSTSMPHKSVQSYTWRGSDFLNGYRPQHGACGKAHHRPLLGRNSFHHPQQAETPPHPHSAKGIFTYFSRFMELNERTKTQGWPGESPLR